MLSLIEAAGWPVWPIIFASIIAVGIIGERMWSLRKSVVVPKDLLSRVLNEYKRSGVTQEMIKKLQQHSL